MTNPTPVKLTAKQGEWLELIGSTRPYANWAGSPYALFLSLVKKGLVKRVAQHKSRPELMSKWDSYSLTPYGLAVVEERQAARKESV